MVNTMWNNMNGGLKIVTNMEFQAFVRPTGHPASEQQRCEGLLSTFW